VKVKVSPAARKVLEWLRDHENDDDLITGGVEVWYGLNRTSWPTLMQLLRLCFVSQNSVEQSHYHINESGKRFLEGLPPYTDRHGRHHETLADALSTPTDSASGKK